MTPLQVTGHARSQRRDVEHRAKPDEQVGVIAVATPPDVRVVSVTPAVVELRLAVARRSPGHDRARQRGSPAACR
jgi:hypothetical protein